MSVWQISVLGIFFDLIDDYKINSYKIKNKIKWQQEVLMYL